MGTNEYSWPSLISQLLRREDLSPSQATWAMHAIIDGNANDAQIAAFAVALRAKGESAGEVLALSDAMRERALPIEPIPDAVDIVGTGGDGARTANFSTMAAIVVAATGVPVLKHGSRAVSSSSGASDVLTALGVEPNLGPDEVLACAQHANIGFCFAPRFHSGMKNAAGARAGMGVPTVFNILGPLSNPASPGAAAVGCADVRFAPLMADVLARRGISAIVMRGDDGLDEFTVTAPTQLWLVSDGKVRTTSLDAISFGVARAELEELRGGDAGRNAEIARGVFGGAPGPVADMVVLNAATALVAHAAIADSSIFSSDEGLAAAFAEELARARQSLTSGAAQDTLDRWVAASIR